MTGGIYSVVRRALGRVVKRQLDVLCKVDGVGQRVLKGEVLHRLGGQFVDGRRFAVVTV